MIIENKLVQSVIEKIDAEDTRAAEMMAAGMLQDFSEYRFSAGYRKALRDAKTLIEQTLEELMKE